MAYLIDGHNLIGVLPDIHLSDLDDEQALVERLRQFCQVSRKRAEVFFDNAPPERARSHKSGLLTARFIAAGRTADTAIRMRLGQLGGEARNWTVVSADRQVQADARAMGARVLSSPAFARLLDQAAEQARTRGEDTAASNGDVDYWLGVFTRGE